MNSVWIAHFAWVGVEVVEYSQRYTPFLDRNASLTARVLQRKRRSHYVVQDELSDKELRSFPLL